MGTDDDGHHLLGRRDPLSLALLGVGGAGEVEGHHLLRGRIAGAMSWSHHQAARSAKWHARAIGHYNMLNLLVWCARA